MHNHSERSRTCNRKWFQIQSLIVLNGEFQIRHTLATVYSWEQVYWLERCPNTKHTLNNTPFMKHLCRLSKLPVPALLFTPKGRAPVCSPQLETAASTSIPSGKWSGSYYLTFTPNMVNPELALALCTVKLTLCCVVTHSITIYRWNLYFRYIN